MKKILIIIFIISFIGLCHQLTEPNLYVGSFNIRTLGKTKISNKTVVDTICKILFKYDIVAIQEIRDSEIFTVINELVSSLNAYASDKQVIYSYVISPRLGLTSYKEQYAFIYRVVTNGHPRSIQVLDQLVYPNPDILFDRPPFVVEFRVLNSSLSINEFTLMNVHLRPSFVYNESKALRDVVDWYLVRSGTGEKNIGILGDFNFDCSYISLSRRQEVRLILSDFAWYIRDKYPTTISTSNCALDRIIVNTGVFRDAIVPNSNMTYRYNSEFGLSSTDTSAVSDHFPVEIQLN